VEARRTFGLLEGLLERARLHTIRFARLGIADVVLPPMNGPPFATLRNPAHAFSCIDCRHLSTNYQATRQQCSKERNWYVTTADCTHWIEVMVQTFFKGSNCR
jgi:hypothetical protein